MSALGSSPAYPPPSKHVRFTPDSRRDAQAPHGPESAISGRSLLMCEVQLKTIPHTALKEAAKAATPPRWHRRQHWWNIAADALTVDW